MSPMPNDPTRWKEESTSNIVQVAPEEGVRNLSKLILANKYTIWFSFRTPIAYSPDGKSTEMTKKKYSTTTSAHMAYLRGNQEVKEIPHKQFRLGVLRVMQCGVEAAAVGVN